MVSWENRRCVDVAIVEACKIIDLGNGQVGLIPTTSMGNSSSYVQCAEKVIVEVNTSQPVELEGMHDSYVPLDPPNRKAIPVEKPEDVNRHSLYSLRFGQTRCSSSLRYY